MKGNRKINIFKDKLRDSVDMDGLRQSEKYSSAQHKTISLTKSFDSGRQSKLVVQSNRRRIQLEHTNNPSLALNASLET
jgi:hypothetical protein